ncbi:MAG: hypothetical protein ACE5ER_01050 [Nitrospinaceae bacterium]
MSGNIEDAYRHYRNTAAYITTTVIVFSAAILSWVAQKPDFLFPVDGVCKNVFFVLGLIPLFIAILSGVWVQFSIFKGYLKEARIKFAKANQNEPGNWDPNIDFGWADIGVKICVGAFMLSFSTIAIFLSINYFS